MDAAFSGRSRAGPALLASALALVVVVLAGCGSGGAAGGGFSVPPGVGEVGAGSLFSVATPRITTITPAVEGPGEIVAIKGSGFGVAQLATSKVFFTIDGVLADLDAGPVPSASDWRDTQINIKVPSESTTGPLRIVTGLRTFNERFSNEVRFDLASPVTTSITPTSATPGTLVTIRGRNFGTQQFTTSRVFFSTTTSSAFQTIGTSRGGIDAGPVINSTDWTNTSIVIPVPVNAHLTGTGAVGNFRVVLGLNLRNQRTSSAAAFSAVSLPFAGVSVVERGGADEVGVSMDVDLDGNNVPYAAYVRESMTADAAAVRVWNSLAGRFEAPPAGNAETITGGNIERLAMGLDSVNVSPARPILVYHNRTAPSLLRIAALSNDRLTWTRVDVTSVGLETGTSSPIAVVNNLRSGLIRAFVRKSAGTGYIGCFRQLTQPLTGPADFQEVFFENLGSAPSPDTVDPALRVGEAVAADLTAPQGAPGGSAIIGVAWLDPDAVRVPQFVGRVLYSVSEDDGRTFLRSGITILTAGDFTGLGIGAPEVGNIGQRLAVTFSGNDKGSVKVFAIHRRKGSNDTDLIMMAPTPGKNPDDPLNWKKFLLVSRALEAPTGTNAAPAIAAASNLSRVIVAYRDRLRGLTVAQLNTSTNRLLTIAQPVRDVATLPGAYPTVDMSGAAKAVVGFRDPSVSVGDAFLFVER